MRCAGCGADLGRVGTVGRRDTCPRCAEDLRSCRNCRFYDTAAANACREPQAERVVDKVRSNFCDYFTPARVAAAPPADGGSARDALDRLFRKG